MRTMAKKGRSFSLLGALLLAVSLLVVRPAHASTTFTVNTPEDFFDTDPGDGTCDASATFLIPCTLRAAIEEANATPGADTIDFNIPANAVKTISPNSQLPPITDRVTIDGYTQGDATADMADDATENTIVQGGSDAKLLIELEGTDAGAGASGLVIGSNASNTVIKGLVINRFAFAGIFAGLPSTSTGIRVEGNFIGTDASGTADLGNVLFGVSLINPSNNTVGGTLPEARNVISGNGGNGVSIGSQGSKVVGNLIGTQKNGTNPLGNGSSGVHIPGDNITVGGKVSGAANVVAFNDSRG